MDVFRTDRIRNVVLLGHGGAGKTTLAEAMAYLAGLTNRLGKVEDGNTVSDYDKEEIKRHFSITTSVIPVPWQKNKVNILDTPGYFDFVGEVEEAVSAADAAIIVVSGKGRRTGWYPEGMESVREVQTSAYDFRYRYGRGRCQLS